MDASLPVSDDRPARAACADPSWVCLFAFHRPARNGEPEFQPFTPGAYGFECPGQADKAALRVSSRRWSTAQRDGASEADGELPFVTCNAELFEMLAPQLDHELTAGRNTESFVDRVRLAIQEKLTGRRSAIEDIADVLRVSPRTLQRRLQDDGYSFQRVLEEARRQLARHYLVHSHLDLNDAAFLLGYNDAGSFVRAFRAWEGVPPARWREEQRSQAVH